MPALKKLTISLLIIFACFFSLFLLANKPALADKALSQKEYEKLVSDNNPNFTGEDLGKAFAENIVHFINIATAGPVTKELKKTDGGGAIPQVGNLIAYMVGNPPVTTTEYLADLGSNLGLPIKPAYAQGIGWQALRPVLPIWKAFRNVAYIAFVIIFVVIGFMIMFRAKVNPQTVITIQDALPRLVITLLLITFSYAIAGLMIDLIYITIYLFVGILKLGGLLEKTAPALDILFSLNPLGITFGAGKDVSVFIQGPGEAIESLVGGMYGYWQTEGTIFQVVGGVAKGIIAIALLFSMFKLLFALLLSYLGIVLSVIFSPFTILFNALPGSSSFGNWLKGLLANVAPFPVVAAMFVLAAILVGPRYGAACDDPNNPWCVEQGIGFSPQVENQEEVWVPPMLISSGGKGGRATANTFQGLIALGIIMLMPKAVSQIKKMLKVEPSGFGGAIMGGLLAGPKALGGAVQTGTNIAQTWHYLKRPEKDYPYGKPQVKEPQS